MLVRVNPSLSSPYPFFKHGNQVENFVLSNLRSKCQSKQWDKSDMVPGNFKSCFNTGSQNFNPKAMSFIERGSKM